MLIIRIRIRPFKILGLDTTCLLLANVFNSLPLHQFLSIERTLSFVCLCFVSSLRNKRFLLINNISIKYRSTINLVTRFDLKNNLSFFFFFFWSWSLIFLLISHYTLFYSFLSYLYNIFLSLSLPYMYMYNIWKL